MVKQRLCLPDSRSRGVAFQNSLLKDLRTLRIFTDTPEGAVCDLVITGFRKGGFSILTSSQIYKQYEGKGSLSFFFEITGAEIKQYRYL